MDTEQFLVLQKMLKEEIAGAVQVAVVTTVNGKINNLTKKIDEYIISDNDWKIQAQPTIDLGNNLRGFGKVIAYILGICAGFIGIFEFVDSIMNKKK